MMEQIFEGTDPEAGKIVTKKTYKKGDIIYYEETLSYGVFYLGRGTVKIFTQDSNGREVILRLASKGDLLGHGFLLGEKNHRNSAKAIVETDCYFIEGRQFKDLLQNRPELSAMTMRKIGNELTIFQNRCVDLMKKNVRERLASYFCYMAGHHSIRRDQDLKITLQLSREEIASMIGTASETAIRFISEFKELGLISEEDRYFHVRNIEKLQNIGRLH